MRNKDRDHNQLRDISIESNVNIHAEGSVLVSFGNTKVICNASIENNVPRWMKNSDEGWITAEYGMLQSSSKERMSRETLGYWTLPKPDVEIKQWSRIPRVARTIPFGYKEDEEDKDFLLPIKEEPVSYTHLTLPTKA